MATRSPHPHFDDAGTLDWHTDWSAAKAAARAEGKLLLVEMGREACGNCRAFVQGVVPHPAIAPLLQRHVVAFAADADEAESEVMQLAMQLDEPTMLPFVVLCDAEGRFLAGSSDAVLPRRFQETLERLVADS